MSQPWMKFFGKDWCGDRALRSCSLGARGLWLEMLLVMSETEPRGSLLVNGRQVDIKKLAGIVGADKREVEQLFGELDEAGVFSRDLDGTVFSRKMRRDEIKAQQDKAHGKGGGNPALIGGNKPTDKPPDKPTDKPSHGDGVNPKDKAQKPDNPEARGQKEAKPSTAVVAPAARREEFDKIEQSCREALGDAAPADPVIGPIVNLIEQGLTLNSIVGVLLSEAKRSRSKPIRTWFVWATIISERIAAAPKLAAPTNGPDPVAPKVDLGWGDIPEANVVVQIKNPVKQWVTMNFADMAGFRAAVATRAPHLMKFWPSAPATEPALAVAK